MEESSTVEIHRRRKASSGGSMFEALVKLEAESISLSVAGKKSIPQVVHKGGRNEMPC